MSSFVSSGVISSGFLVSAGGQLTVLSGGSAISTTVEVSGTLAVSAGGYAIDTVVLDGGFEQVSAGGIVSGTLISFGGQEVVGGTDLGTVDYDGTQTVIAGGSAINAIVLGLSTITVSSGGVTSDSIIGSGGSNGFETVSSGGLAVSTAVEGGALSVESGGTSLFAAISGNGEEDVDGGIVSGSVISEGYGYISGGGTAYATVIGDFGVLQLEAGRSAQGGITFVGSGGVLNVDPPSFGEKATLPTTPISGFAVGDQIDLGGVPYSSADTASFDNGVLTISAGGEAYTLNLPDLPNGTTFVLNEGFFSYDSLVADSTLVSLSNIPCFAAGTRIRTEAGDIAVEYLKLGDRVLTQDGGLQPITWIGHRHIAPGRHPQPRQVQPVRIEAHAFGPNQPKAALSLSPDHAIFAEGVLIPIKHLINGVTVRQVAVARITYFHVELAAHAVILAEGLPVESYLDTGDRSAFSGADVADLYPAFGSERQDVALLVDVLGYAPIRILGPEVERVRSRLAARAQARESGNSLRLASN